ncbi:PTS mannitol transporter subunit IIB, partial [Streptococcus suis]
KDLAKEDTFAAAVAQTEANKGKSSDALSGLAAKAVAPTTTATDRRIENVVFACDAGMGSSAMGASVLRNKFKKAGIDGVTVTNQAIANLDGTA